MKELLIGEGKASEINQLAKLMHEYDIYEYSLDKNCLPDSLNKTRIDFKKFFKDKSIKFTVIEQKGKIVALVNWRISRPAGVKTGLLQNIIVTKKARGQGYGKMLVDYLLTYFKRKDCKQVTSFVRAKNFRAKEFWKSYGFSFSEQGFHISKKI